MLPASGCLTAQRRDPPWGVLTAQRKLTQRRALSKFPETCRRPWASLWEFFEKVSNDPREVFQSQNDRWASQIWTLVNSASTRPCLVFSHQIRGWDNFPPSQIDRCRNQSSLVCFLLSQSLSVLAAASTATTRACWSVNVSLIVGIWLLTVASQAFRLKTKTRRTTDATLKEQACETSCWLASEESIESRGKVEFDQGYWNLTNKASLWRGRSRWLRWRLWVGCLARRP